MDSEPIWRARKPGGDRIPARVQPHHARRISGSHHRGGGINRLAAGDSAAVYRRSRLFLQVEHGLDARHAELFRARANSPEVSPARSHVRDAVSSSREFYFAAVAR